MEISFLCLVSGLSLGHRVKMEGLRVKPGGGD